MRDAGEFPPFQRSKPRVQEMEKHTENGQGYTKKKQKPTDESLVES